MPIKRLLDARRMRKAPPRGFGWIDHRLLRDGYLGRCSSTSLALYVLLVCASDAQGLSYYSDYRIAELLCLEPSVLRQARRELIGLGLIAYQKPLYQLLSLQGQLMEHNSEPPPQQGRSPTCEASPQAATKGLSLKAIVESLLEKNKAL